VPGQSPKQFHGFKEDIETVGEFIRLYTTRNRRWASPKFLIGESYGTTRAAGLSGYLQDRHGMYFNGIMLVSSILNFETARFDPGNDLPYLLFLPTYTATAWYHKQLASDLQADLRKTLNQVEDFARNEYWHALMKGDVLTGEERKSVVQKLSRFTGLSENYIEQTNLRINIYRFTKELLREKRRTVGRLDSRFQGMDVDAAGEAMEYDPSYAAIQGPYTATLNHYIRTELKYESDLPYEILTDRVHPWSFRDYENQYLNVAETLRAAMNQNPSLKVFIANGYYDLATPYFATLYTFDHIGLEPELRENVSMGFYESGHMMYIHLPSLVRMKKDLATFLESAVNRRR
jgi:carboxypeptidase C (cathepsin A)